MHDGCSTIYLPRYLLQRVPGNTITLFASLLTQNTSLTAIGQVDSSSCKPGRRSHSPALAPSIRHLVVDMGMNKLEGWCEPDCLRSVQKILCKLPVSTFGLSFAHRLCGHFLGNQEEYGFTAAEKWDLSCSLGYAFVSADRFGLNYVCP